ncbi:KAT8 regulatory NSL complex subunit 1-like isoform X2 [Dromaius novaehollandiae]|uniref:KAT8 regulatory NSL complex subunit 1-like isoform X2 n=1 Tax=Dromaius novaehollandiae TaxID=8790 RepID=UPI0031200A17
MAPAPRPPPAELPPARAAAARGRQAALRSRARRLRRRLRALQARQVERHVRQQLAGLARYLGRAGRGGLSPALAPDLRLLAASATARLRATQGACDSDATDSSSGGGGSGEDTETEGESAGRRRPSAASPRRHHAECQWAMERAAIICRWTWLQAQISDLEYRIRQQTDIYKQLRANKGPVVLGGDRQPENLMKQQGRLGSVSLMTSKKNKWLLHSSSSIPKCPTGDTVPSRFLRNMEKQSSGLTQSLGNPMCQSPSCTPISGSPGPPKACTTSPRQVNGVFNCLHAGSSGSNSLIILNAEEILGKQKQLHNLLPASSISDNTCVAARIRPICKYKKRKLVRATSVSHLSRKPLKPLTMKCSCEWPHSCILCSCKTSLQTVDPDTMSLGERIALLDSGFHPILSLSHGNPLHLHFETLLREDRLLSCKLTALKMSHFGKQQDPPGSLFPKLHSSLLSVSSSLFKGERQLEGAYSHSFPVSSPQAHKYSPLHHSPSWYPETPTPSSSQIPFAGSSAMSSKRRKVECSYDINNIVIPTSMAAATRVEKLQYKEIDTPSWRIVQLKDLEPFSQVDFELEDTSDEMYLSHHSKYEELERAHWDSWAPAVSHKRGSRSSNKVDGRWTGQPQPASPVTGLNCLNDLYLHSSTGLHSPETCNNLQPPCTNSRTRMVLSCSEDARSCLETLDEAIWNVQPWEPRTFPLSDAAYQALLQQPNEDSCQQADFQPWVSSHQQGIRPTSIDTAISNFREMQFSSTHLQTDGTKNMEEFMVQQYNRGKLVNKDKPDLWGV